MKNLTCACGAVFLASQSTDLLAEIEAHLAEAHAELLRPTADEAKPISEHSLELEEAT